MQRLYSSDGTLRYQYGAMAHETSTSRILPKHSFTEGRKNLTYPQQTNTLASYVFSENVRTSNFLCVHNILTEGVSVTELFSNA